MQEVKQLYLGGFAGDGFAVLLHVDCGATEDGEPQGGNAGWDKQDA